LQRVKTLDEGTAAALVPATAIGRLLSQGEAAKLIRGSSDFVRGPLLRRVSSNDTPQNHALSGRSSRR
jgi:hypothetical protein